MMLMASVPAQSVLLESDPFEQYFQSAIPELSKTKETALQKIVDGSKFGQIACTSEAVWYSMPSLLTAEGTPILWGSVVRSSKGSRFVEWDTCPSGGSELHMPTRPFMLAAEVIRLSGGTLTFRNTFVNLDEIPETIPGKTFEKVEEALRAAPWHDSRKQWRGAIDNTHRGPDAVKRIVSAFKGKPNKMSGTRPSSKPFAANELSIPLE
jgi:hypothetical protein